MYEALGDEEKYLEYLNILDRWRVLRNNCNDKCNVGFKNIIIYVILKEGNLFDSYSKSIFFEKICFYFGDMSIICYFFKVFTPLEINKIDFFFIKKRLRKLS